MSILRDFTSVKRIDDETGRVAKFVFTKDEPAAVAEAVLYRYPDYQTRTVICCSTQSGCPVGCRFCGAGDAFVRNLTADEIAGQPFHLLREVYEREGVHFDNMGRLQIMFMSMGEPFLNMRNLIEAIKKLNAAFPNAALLVSTTAPKVSGDLWSDFVDASQMIDNIGLQFSVHETTDSARNELIPFRAKYALEEIAGLGYEWHIVTGRKPFFNYCAHDGNSTDDDASRLLKLFDPAVFEATVSVICERNEGMPASNDHQRGLATGFSEKLVSRGFSVRVFDPAGQDTIGGGCGQLWFVQDWMRSHPESVKASRGAGLPVRHAPGTAP